MDISQGDIGERFNRLVKNCNARDCKNYGLEFCIDVCIKRNIDENNKFWKNYSSEYKIFLIYFKKPKMPYISAKIKSNIISTPFKSAIVCIFVLMTLLSTSMYTFGYLNSSQLTNTSGITANVDIGIYSDSDCKNNLTSIDWGIVYPGEIVYFTAYVRNLGNVDITILMDTLNWMPISAENYLNFSWNYANQTLIKNEVTPVTFTLDISQQIENIESFSFDIILTSFG
jgi:hypothetical protein